MRVVLLSALLLSVAALPAIAADLSPLPSNASWFDPATKTATSDTLTADPNYSRINKEEKASDSMFTGIYQAKCISSGKNDLTCFASTRKAVLEWARIPSGNLPALCNQWQTLWKKEAYSQVSLRNNMCTKEANISLYKYIIKEMGVDRVGCVCN